VGGYKQEVFVDKKPVVDRLLNNLRGFVEELGSWVVLFAGIGLVVVELVVVELVVDWAVAE
jgi:hypothetical protein